MIACNAPCRLSWYLVPPPNSTFSTINLIAGYEARCPVRGSERGLSFRGMVRSLETRAALKVRTVLERIKADNMGDGKPVGQGTSERRIDCRPGGQWAPRKIALTWLWRYDDRNVPRLGPTARRHLRHAPRGPARKPRRTAPLSAQHATRLACKHAFPEAVIEDLLNAGVGGRGIFREREYAAERPSWLRGCSLCPTVPELAGGRSAHPLAQLPKNTGIR